MNNKQKIALVAGALVLGATIAYILWRRKNKPSLEEPKEQKVLKDAFDNLTFETNKDIIKKESFPYLDELANTMMESPSWTLRIIGHTDNVGKDDFNMDLSLRRANSVKKYLVSKGVNESIITSEGKGETMPIATNDTKEGRALNRRVEFVITKPDNTTTTTIS